MIDGPLAESRRAKLAKANQPIPDGLWTPTILPGGEEWLTAFWDLSTDRQIGMGAGPIPGASLERYTRHMMEDEARSFSMCIRSMDGAWLKAQKDKATE